MKEFRVGVFPYQGAKRVRYSAYTTWYNPNWAHCCEHKVLARNGTEAKKLAIIQHKAECK